MAGKGGGNVPKMRKGSKPGSVPSTSGRQIDWMIVGAVVAVLIVLGGLVWYLAPKFLEKREAQTIAPSVVEEFVPTAENPDPSNDIEGVVKIFYPAGKHVNGAQWVDYDQSPPFGGPHDEIWATCTGVAYEAPLRSENAVHALEHGAIWITYNPDTLSAEDLDYLKKKVSGEQYLFISPYPGLSDPISIQSWGHQLKLDSAQDERIDQFITALRRNTTPGVFSETPQMGAYPEPNATCTALPGAFDPNSPPPGRSGEVPAELLVPMEGGETDPAESVPTEPMPQAPLPAG